MLLLLKDVHGKAPAQPFKKLNTTIKLVSKEKVLGDPDSVKQLL